MPELFDHTDIAASETALERPSADDPLGRQKALVALGRRAIAPPESSILIQDAASLLAEMLQADFGIAAELVAGGETLDVRLAETGRAYGTPAAKARRGQVNAEGHESLAGFVLDAALTVAVEDFAADKRFTDLFLRKHGMQSAVAAPLKLLDRSLGALGACFREPHRFTDEDVLFVETVSHLVATTIARGQAEHWLAEERRVSSGVFDTVEAIVLILDPGGNVTKTNAACERLTGFSLTELRGRRLEATLAVPDELYLFQNALGRVLAGQNPLELESRLFTKHGRQRFIAWTLSAVHDGRGDATSVIVTGIDVTRERQLEAKLLTESSAARAVAAPAAAPDPVAAPEPAAPLNAERRKRPRRSYPYRQMIAAVKDGKLPPADEFFAVTCNDIGAGGFSFLTHRPLPSDTLIVALGSPPKLTYLTAKVAHVNRVEHQGRWVFLVGCHYTGRAEY